MQCILENFLFFLVGFCFQCWNDCNFLQLFFRKLRCYIKSSNTVYFIPKNSIRYGSSFEKEKTSIIPPLTEKSPGSVTKSTRLNLYSK